MPLGVNLHRSYPHTAIDSTVLARGHERRKRFAARQTLGRHPARRLRHAEGGSLLDPAPIAKGEEAAHGLVVAHVVLASEVVVEAQLFADVEIDRRRGRPHGSLEAVQHGRSIAVVDAPERGAARAHGHPPLRRGPGMVQQLLAPGGIQGLELRLQRVHGRQHRANDSSVVGEPSRDRFSPGDTFERHHSCALKVTSMVNEPLARGGGGGQVKTAGLKKLSYCRTQVVRLS